MSNGSKRSRGEPHDMLATAFQTDGTGCEHSNDGACSDCLADVAIRTLKEYILDELAATDRFEEWYAANDERLDDIDPDMNHAEVVAHYLVDVVLPSQNVRPVVDVTLPGGADVCPACKVDLAEAADGHDEGCSVGAGEHCDHHQHNSVCGWDDGYGDCDAAASDDCVHCPCCCTCLGCEYGPQDGMLLTPTQRERIGAPRDGTDARAPMRRPEDRAADLLVHYFREVWRRSGLTWDGDNDAEVRAIVDAFAEIVADQIREHAQDAPHIYADGSTR